MPKIQKNFFFFQNQIPLKSDIFILPRKRNKRHEARHERQACSYNFEAMFFIFGCETTEDQVKLMTSFFEMLFLTLIIVADQNKCHFLNPGRKVEKVNIFREDNYQ